MLAMVQLEYGLRYLNDKLTHMLLYNSKVLIQNHAVWSYVIEMNILDVYTNYENIKRDLRLMYLPEMFVRIENADVKNHW